MKAEHRDGMRCIEEKLRLLQIGPMTWMFGSASRIRIGAPASNARAERVRREWPKRHNGASASSARAKKLEIAHQLRREELFDEALVAVIGPGILSTSRQSPVPAKEGNQRGLPRSGFPQSA